MVVLFKSGSIARIATFLIAAAVLAACLAVTVPREASAIGPFIVDGKVTDNAGRPIVGASVVAAMYNGTTLVASQGTTTDGDGMYTISFATDLWKAGFNVTSTATYDSVQVSDTFKILDSGDPFATIDLQFPFEIPQFGSIVGFVVAAALVGIVAVVLLARKGK